MTMERRNPRWNSSCTGRRSWPRCPTPPRLLLTVEEAAERIGICRSNMFKLIRRGEVHSVKVGRLRRVTPDALEDFVRRLSAEEDPAA